MRLRSISLMGTVAALSLLPIIGNQAIAQTALEVENLQRQIEALQEQLDRLQAQVSDQASAQSPPAPTAAVVEPGNDKISLSLSGQVNRGILITDDGSQTDAFFVDNDNSSTRIRLMGEAIASDDLTVGTNIEVQFESNSTASVNQDTERNVGPNNFTERKLELYVDSAKLGRLSLGQGDTASNGTSEVDLSGTSVVGYSGVSDLAGGLLFRDGDDLTAISIGQTFSNLDGLSRDDRLRYDSPSFNGLKVSGSVIADERFDIATTYSRDYDGTKVAAALAYADAPGDFERLNGSASILLANGFNLTLAAGTNDPDDGGEEGVFYYGKVGYQAGLFEWGTTAVAVDYYVGEDLDADGDEADTFGVFLVQNVNVIATEFYAGYRHYELDRDGADLEPIDALLTGARVKF